MEKKATNSLILGIVSIILFLIMLLGGYDFLVFMSELFGNLPGKWASFIIYLPIGIISAVGLVFGIEGMRSVKRLQAIIGILLSLISFLIVAGLLSRIFEACC
ncbi:MAG: hypothetical protein V1905_00410 [bacterium]